MQSLAFVSPLEFFFFFLLLNRLGDAGGAHHFFNMAEVTIRTYACHRLRGAAKRIKKSSRPLVTCRVRFQICVRASSVACKECTRIAHLQHAALLRLAARDHECAVDVVVANVENGHWQKKRREEKRGSEINATERKVR